MVERGTGPKSLMERLKGCQELDCCLAVWVMCVESIHPFSGVPCPPFYRPRGEQGLQMGEREKTRGKEGPSKAQGLPFPLSLFC